MTKYTPETLILEVFTTIVGISEGGKVNTSDLVDFRDVLDNEEARIFLARLAENEPLLLEAMVQTTLSLLSNSFTLDDITPVAMSVMTIAGITLVLAERQTKLDPFKDTLDDLGDKND